MAEHTEQELAKLTRDVLLIASLEGVDNYARILEEQLGSRVDLAVSRRDGLAALRKAEFGVVVVEEGLVEGNPAWADQVWEASGFAVPLQVNFSISGASRIGREIRAALTRRDSEQKLARAAVAMEIENELKSSLTGLLLQSELALREPSVPPALEPKLRHVVELAGAIRERLEVRRKDRVRE